MKGKLLFPLALMLVFALTRWPTLMPPNFSAGYAIAFCAGLYFPGKFRWLLPLGTLLLTSLGLNFYYGAGFSELSMWLATLSQLAAFAALVWLGGKFKPRQHWLTLLGGGFLGAVLFYLVTNFASWLYDPQYPKNLQGLIQALTTGTPGWPHTWEFFRNTLMSGGLFTGLFCGAMKLGAAEETEDETADDSEEAPAATPEKAEA
jgi:hypothetical protein